MRLQITSEQFQLNEILKMIQGNINWNIRVGYTKRGLTPLLVANVAGGYLVRNINCNSMKADIEELTNLFNHKYDKFEEMEKNRVLLLDTILEYPGDFVDVQQVLLNDCATEVELKESLLKVSGDD